MTAAAARTWDPDIPVIREPNGQTAWDLDALEGSALPESEPMTVAAQAGGAFESAAPMTRARTLAFPQRGAAKRPSDADPRTAALRAELRAALAAVLVADYRSEHAGNQRISDVGVNPVNRSNPSQEEA